MAKIGSSSAANPQAHGTDVAPPDSTSGHTQPQALSPAQVSINTFSELEKPSEHNQQLKHLVNNSLLEGTLRIAANHRNQQTFTQQVNLRETGPATLSITTQLNERSEYDITQINLTPHSTGATSSLTLPTSTPSQTRERQPALRCNLQHRLTGQFSHQATTPWVSNSDLVARARNNPSSTIVSNTVLSDELKTSIVDFIKDSGPKLFQHRPDELKSAVDLLRPLRKSTRLAWSDKLAVIDASEQLRVMQEKKPGRYPKAEALNRQIGDFVGSATELHSAVNQLSEKFEQAAVVTSFKSFMKKNYPTMITTDSHGKETLTEQGAKNYTHFDQQFKRETQSRYVIPIPSERPGTTRDAVAKIIEDGFSHYQDALREPNNSTPTKRRLLECAQIIAELTTAKPETVTKDRIATVFPSGITDPSKLVQGQVYKEEGFVFIGGERPSDSGYRMQIKMTKGYPVDARRYYGHSLNNEKKLQWISLPGAEFRFDGMKQDDSRPVYKFSQVDRQPQLSDL